MVIARFGKSRYLVREGKVFRNTGNGYWTARGLVKSRAGQLAYGARL